MPAIMMYRTYSHVIVRRAHSAYMIITADNTDGLLYKPVALLMDLKIYLKNMLVVQPLRFARF